MVNNKNNLLKFIYSKKYILITLLIISLIISYLIQRNENLFKTHNDTKKIEKIESIDPMVKFKDHMYYLWYDKSLNNHLMDRIIGAAFEKAQIGSIFDDKKRNMIPQSVNGNLYRYFVVRSLDPININLLEKSFKIEKKNFINNELNNIKQFRLNKDNQNIMVNKEYDLFKIRDSELYFKEELRTTEMQMSKAKDLISKMGDESHLSKNVEVLEDLKLMKEKVLKKVDKKTFFYPEIVILVLYLLYFSWHFFTQIMREKD